MLELKSLLSPVSASSVVMALVFGVSLLFMAKYAFNKRDESRKGMAAIRRKIIVHHSRKMMVLYRRLCSFKTLTDMMSEIDAIPLCDKKKMSVVMLSDIFISDSLSHVAFLHFIKIQPSEAILKSIDDNEAVLIKMLEYTDKERLSNNLIVQGFDLMDDARFIENRHVRAETIARGNRWVQYGHHLNERLARVNVSREHEG